MRAIAVDTGGTFTDMVVLDQTTGALSVLKLPSTPSDPGRAITDGLAEAFADSVTPSDVLSLSHGTTVGTNALLTGAGARVGLFVTEGYSAHQRRVAPRPQRGHQPPIRLLCNQEPPGATQAPQGSKGARRLPWRSCHSARRGEGG